MKRTIAALILAAAAATPAMAQTYVYPNGYVYSNGMTAYPVQSPAYVSYGMYGDIRQWDPRIINATFAQDPIRTCEYSC